MTSRILDTLRKTVDLEKIKEKFLQMDLITKRTHYACKENFVVLDSIKTWTQYVDDNNLKSSISEENDEKAYSVDDEVNSKISLWQGDITHLEIDAIVNAANSSLLGGGGVDGCIHRAAGPHLYDECESLNGCETGSAKITGGYQLPAKYVIHTVGPRGEKPALLKSAYETSLNLMLENQLRSIAYPCISTGIYGYPAEEAVHVAASSIRKFLDEHKSEVDRIIFTVFLDTDKEIYERELFNYFPIKSNDSATPKSADVTTPKLSKTDSPKL